MRLTYTTFVGALAALSTTVSAAPAVIASTGFGIDPLGTAEFDPAGATLTDVLFDSANAHTGSGYLLITLPAATRQFYSFGTPLKLANNKNYTVSVWGKSSKNDGNCFMAVSLRDNAGTTLDLITQPLNTTYAQYTVTANSGMSKGQGGAAIFYATCTGNVKEQVYVDDFAVTRP